MSQSTEGLKIQATDIVTFQLIFKNIPFLEKKKNQDYLKLLFILPFHSSFTEADEKEKET